MQVPPCVRVSVGCMHTSRGCGFRAVETLHSEEAPQGCQGAGLGGEMRGWMGWVLASPGSGPPPVSARTDLLSGVRA